jgi:putative membrane protein
VWDVAVTAFHMMTPIKEPPLPTALFGTAIALFMGFRTNAAYARWWEARTLWGALINASRSLARITRSLTKGEPEDSEMRYNIILRQIALRTQCAASFADSRPMKRLPVWPERRSPIWRSLA